MIFDGQPMVLVRNWKNWDIIDITGALKNHVIIYTILLDEEQRVRIWSSLYKYANI